MVRTEVPLDNGGLPLEMLDDERLAETWSLREAIFFNEIA